MPAAARALIGRPPVERITQAGARGQGPGRLLPHSFSLLPFPRSKSSGPAGHLGPKPAKHFAKRRARFGPSGEAVEAASSGAVDGIRRR
jgi:hypothetical protein